MYLFKNELMDIQSWNKKGKIFKHHQASLRFIREGKGETLVLIHGFPTSSWDYAWIFPELIQQFDCFCADLIGLGYSSTTAKSISISDQAQALEALLIANGVTSAHILAHDLGDTVALELLSRRTAGKGAIEWQSCTLMNGGIFQETNRPRLIQKLLNSPLGPLIGQLSSKRTYVKTMRRIFGKATQPTKLFLDTSWTILLNNNGRRMIPVISNYLTERKRHKSRWEVPMFNPTIPMAMINGVEDPISGRTTAERFQAKVPNSITVKLPLGHYPHVEDPAAVLNAFNNFHKSP